MWCTIDEVYKAYLDCRRRKRNTKSCAAFEQHELANISVLWTDLNTHNYTIGKSIAFCVTRPKVREVFAADFRDRVVHHLLMMRLLPIFEGAFIDDTYNCRKGKGTDYGVKRVAEMAEQYEDGWVLKCDLQGFFMTIHKPTLADALESLIRTRYHGNDTEDMVWLARMIAEHSPELNCERRGDLTLWDELPANKSLFCNGKDYGQAIGNLTSQIFANYYLQELDDYLSNVPNTRCGRYVDDFVVFANTKDELLQLLPHIRQILSDRKMVLHPHKVYLQPVRHGLTFIGSTIKHGRIYAGNRTVGNATNLIRKYNRYYQNLDVPVEVVTQRFVQRYNSYMGYLMHRKTYAIRRKLWEQVSDEIMKYCYIVNMAVMKVRNKYKLNAYILKGYGKRSNTDLGI
jgi:RNA-directed DNA polymerase